MEYSRQWAVRCTHELEEQGSENSIFLTLTYDNEHLPEYASLERSAISYFMRKLRDKMRYEDKCNGLSTENFRRVKYFGCGEYGDQLGRPHYHIILFGIRPNDEQIHGRTKKGNPIYVSNWLSDIWEKGHVNYGDVTYDSCAYVARYVTKKITGSKAIDHYAVMSDIHTGEIFGKIPEYISMSTQNGIGKQWFEKYKDDLYNYDKATIQTRNGIVDLKVPRYYDRLLEKEDPERLKEIKAKRVEYAKQFGNNETEKRRLEREKHALLVNKLKYTRNIENMG